MEINQVPLTTASSNQFGHTVNFGSNASNNSSNERYHRITVILINKVKLCRRQISKNQFIRVQQWLHILLCINLNCNTDLKNLDMMHLSICTKFYTGLKLNNFEYLNQSPAILQGENFMENCRK